MRTLNFICQTEGFKVQKSKLHSKLNRNHLFSINFLRNRSPLEANFHQNTINPMHLTTLLLYKVKKSKVYFQLFFYKTKQTKATSSLHLKSFSKTFSLEKEYLISSLRYLSFAIRHRCQYLVANAHISACVIANDIRKNLCLLSH